jgi:peptidoglycan/LPS O-acetylase OafA/YrhL
MSGSAAPVSAGKHDGIDALRGLAALLVVLFHMNQMGFGLTSPAWTQAGLLGVNLFFTLSGFLIARCVMAPAVFTGKSYLTSRARRILPNYFIALFLVITVVDVRSLLHVPLPQAAGDLLTHLLLVHGWFPAYSTSIMGPFWTLSHEWWFYLLMLAAAPLLRGPRWWLVPLGMAGIALTARLGQAQEWWNLPGGLTHPLAMWDQFAAGILAAGWTLKSSTTAPKPWLRPVLLVLGTALVVWSVWKVCQQALLIDPEKFKGGAFGDRVMTKFWDRRSNILWFSPVLAAGVALLVAGLWLAPGLRWKLRLLPWMGQVSYSTYLYHMPVILCFGRAFKNLPAGSFWAQPVPAFFLVLGMVYAFSAFAWHYFEKPWMQRRG